MLSVLYSAATGLCVATATIIAWPAWKFRHEHKLIANAQRAVEIGCRYGLGVLTPPFVVAIFFSITAPAPEILVLIFLSSTLWLIGSAIVAMLIWRIIGLTLPKFVEQDGTLCPICAYCLLGVQSMRCPECGNAFDYDDLETTEQEFRSRSQTKATHATSTDDAPAR